MGWLDAWAPKGLQNSRIYFILGWNDVVYYTTISTYILFVMVILREMISFGQSYLSIPLLEKPSNIFPCPLTLSKISRTGKTIFITSFSRSN